MDARNLADLRRMAGAAGSNRIRLFGEVGGLRGRDRRGRSDLRGQVDGAEIPDPYGGTAADFGHVLDLLGSAAPVIASRLARRLEPAADGHDTPA
jgi:protein-tyrosine-phosphatase